MFDKKKIEEILKLTDEELFHEKDYAKASLKIYKDDINCIKEILKGILNLDIVLFKDHNLNRLIEYIVNRAIGIFDTIKNYYGNNRENIGNNISQFITAINNRCPYVLAWISFKSFYTINSKLEKSGLDDLSQIPSKLTEIEKIKEQISKYELDARKGLESIKDIANKVGVSKYSSVFEKQAEKHKTNSWFWFLGIIGLLLIIIGFAVCLLKDCFFKLPDGASWGIIVQFTTAKLIIFSILCVALSWTIKSYKANKHNEVLNKHRQNALDIFEAFVNGTSDEQTKNAVLLQAVQSIFAQQNTGYNDNETETGNAQTKILEFVGSSIKNNAK